jgi:hypothetical protein
MKYVVAIALAMTLGGCWYYERPLVADAVYSRSEVDALQAEAACKAIARNMLQLERCRR